LTPYEKGEFEDPKNFHKLSKMQGFECTLSFVQDSHKAIIAKLLASTVQLLGPLSCALPTASH